MKTSDVLLVIRSLDDAPESLAAASVSDAGAVGAVASIVTVSPVEVALFPEESVSVTVTTQAPSPNVVRVHVPELRVQETLVEPALDAVRPAVPVKLPATVNVGVLSDVVLSVLEVPRSEPATRSGVAGVAIVVVLITTLARVAAAESTLLIVCLTATE